MINVIFCRLLCVFALVSGTLTLQAQLVTRVELSGDKNYSQLEVLELQRTLDSLNARVGRLMNPSSGGSEGSETATLPTSGPEVERILTATHNCGDSLTYQGVTYGTRRFGAQCWFTQNLRTTTFLNGDALTELTSENSSQVQPLGFENLYVSPPSEDIEAYGYYYSPTSGRDQRGLCPCGWHTPDSLDWVKLLAFTGGTGVTGANNLKSIEDGGNDAFGFNWRMSGRADQYAGYNFEGQGGFLASLSTDAETGYTYVLIWDPYGTGLEWGGFPPQDLIPMRCLKD